MGRESDTYTMTTSAILTKTIREQDGKRMITACAGPLGSPAEYLTGVEPSVKVRFNK